jgi:hypothetical protein
LAAVLHCHKATDGPLILSPQHTTNKHPNTKEANTIKMKFTILSILTFITVVLAAAQPQKAVIVSYPNDTPDSIVDQAKDAIIAAGGIITHEYKLIK